MDTEIGGCWQDCRWKTWAFVWFAAWLLTSSGFAIKLTEARHKMVSAGVKP